MASVTVALLLIFAAVNLLNYRETTAHVDFLIETIHVNGGNIPKMTEDMARHQVSKETSSIAHSVAERHGGRISARKVGGDLEIRVALPRARASET